MKIFAAVVALLLSGTVVMAADNDTRYVTDQLEITLRSGESLKHQIVRMLPSGTAVELLETDDETKYSRVRTSDDGTEGWVLSRYLDKQPSARDRLARATQQLEQLKNDKKQLQQSLNQTTAAKEKLTRDLNTADSKNEQLTRELEHIKQVSAATIAVDKANQDLKIELQQLKTRYEQAENQIDTLQDDSSRQWVMVGAGIILLGIMIGLIIPKIRWRRKSSWGSL